jgi:hypothetical protein
MGSGSEQRASCCCGNPPGASEGLVVLNISPEQIPLKPVIPACSRLTLMDRLGGWAARWDIGRSNYHVAPGLYSIGKPDANSAVLVTANYKLSFDSLRKELAGLDAWVLVLDTRGINVWCAAGKGTFGTDELVRQIRSTGLRERISHHTLILPQLGAPGVAAHSVKQQTGFKVIYGPVRARDIKAFLAGGMKAAPEMRQVTFGLADRLAVVPVELVAVTKYLLLLVLALILGQWLFGITSARQLLVDIAPYLGAVLAGTVAVPALLPWIPFRSFALKGWLLGIFWALALSGIQEATPARLAGNLLLLPAISAFLALNFTGCTTFTSQNGVNREIRWFARPMAISAILGLGVLTVRMFW